MRSLPAAQSSAPARHVLAIFSLAVVGLAAPALAVAAASSTEARAIVSPDFFGGSGPVDNIVNGNGPVTASGSATGGGNSSGSSWTTTDFGVIRMAGDAYGSMETSSYGSFSDTATYSAPNVATGTFIQVTFSIMVEGDIAAETLGGSGNWRLQANVGGGAFQMNESGYVYSNGQTQGVPFGLFSANASVQAGLPTTLTVQLSGGAQAAYQVNSGNILPHGSYDLSHTLYWDGVTATLNGAKLNDLSVTSASGTNYLGSLAPVPEPASIQLLMLGLFVLITAAKLQRGAARKSLQTR